MYQHHRRRVSGIRPARRLRLTLIAASTALVMAQGVSPVMADEAPAPADGGQHHTLPVQAATVTPAAPEADDAVAPDEMATMVSTLQKQIIAQQALLQVLQKRLEEQAGEGASAQSPQEQAPAADAKAPPVPSGSADGQPAAAASVPEAGASIPVTPPASSGPSVATGSETPSAPPVRTDTPPAAGAEDRQAPAPTKVTPDADISLSTDTQRQAYASGASVWREIESSIASQHALGIELDEHYVMAGLQDMASHRPLKMSQDEMDRTMSELNRDYIRRAGEAREHQEAEGKAYRIAFSKEKGTYSDAGAWYRIEDRGKGRRLRTTDMAVLQVTGTLPDGTVFDSSGQRGETRTVKVGALLPSVAIGLQKVSPGGRLTVVVPPGKGYGDAGLPPSIPGGATLIFDIIVKDVNGDA